MRFLKPSKALLVASLLLASSVYTNATDPNVKDINKVESELADAQQRLQNVKDRMASSDYQQQQGESISNRIYDAVDSVKSRLSGSSSGDVLPNMENVKDKISNLGSETYAQTAARKIRESLGRDTLIDNAQRVFNDAKFQLSKQYTNMDVSTLGEESTTEKTARRVREILGQATMKDKLQRKYIEARDALNEAKDLDFTAFPEKANYLKERIQQLGLEAVDKITDMTGVEDEETVWNRIKGKLGLTREPTATEKAQLIAQHMKDNVKQQAESILAKGAATGVAASFNRFLSKLGRGPSAAVNMAQQWVSSTPEERNAVRSSHTISNEAHEALDDLLSKLLIEVGDANAERVESIQISVKPKSGVDFNDKPSYFQSFKDSILGTSTDDVTTGSHMFDPKLGYDGLKSKIAEMMHDVKASTWGESMAEKAAALAEESYTDKAARKVREAMGRDTATDKLYNLREQAQSGSILDMIRQRLPSTYKLSDIDLKASLSSLGEESYAEKAARKVRESMGSDTMKDKLHAALDDIKHGSVMSSASQAASNKFDDVKDMLSSFTGETRAERIARKVREALGRDTMLDKAHARVDEAAAYYHSLSSAANLAGKAGDIKDSIVDSASNLASNIQEKVNSVAGAAQPVQKSRFTQVKEAVFGDAKDNKIEAANKLLQEAIAKLDQAKKM